MTVALIGSYLKILPNNTLAVQSSATGDLVISSWDLMQMSRVPAPYNDWTAGDKKLFRHSTDGRFLTWSTSASHLAHVDSMDLKLCPPMLNFWKPKNIVVADLMVEPVSAVSPPDASWVVGLADLVQRAGDKRREVDQLLFLYKTPGASLDYSVSRLFPRGRLASY